MPPPEDNNTQKLIRPGAVQHLLESADNDKLFGEIIIKIKSGKIVQLELRKSFIDERQIYDDF